MTLFTKGTNIYMPLDFLALFDILFLILGMKVKRGPARTLVQTNIHYVA